MTLFTDVLLGASLSTWAFVIFPVGFAAYWVIWIIYCLTLHPLASIPGPLWPAVSRTYLMYRIYIGDSEKAERALHEKYGPLVRIAPNEVSSSDLASIPKIYRIQRPLPKTDFYPTFRPQGISRQADMFTTTDEVAHASYRKIVTPVYTMSAILKQETAIDECSRLFLQRLGEHADEKKEMDFGEWLEMYAYDVVGILFFGKMFGFMEKSEDHESYIESVDKCLPLLTFAANAPSYLRPFIMIAAIMNPATLRCVKAVNGITAAAKEHTDQRRKDTEEENLKRNDILSQLFRIIREKGDKINFTHEEVTLESWVGIIAGADSTAIALRACFYYLMKHPDKLVKVLAEIDAADAAGSLSSPMKYSEGVNLKYTCACIKEAMRLFPSFSTRMARVVPAEGVELAGKHIPKGYRAGINPAVIQYDKTVFGEDSYEFKPERWLESEERSYAMEKAFLAFGTGTRTCTGKNFALAEIHKIVPEILRRFTIQMTHDRPWKTHNAAFTKQRDVTVTVKRRTPSRG